MQLFHKYNTIRVKKLLLFKEKILRKILYFLLLIIFSCGVNFKSGSLRTRDYPDQVLSDFKYISSDKRGIKEWELFANVAKSYNNKNEILLENFSIKFYHPDGNIKSFLSANKGFINISTMNVFAEGNVKIYSENKALLEANKIYWDNQKKRFFSEPNQIVTLWRNNSYVKGYNLNADTELKEVTLDNVRSEVKER